MEQHTVHRQIPSSLLCTACHPVAATNYYIVVGQQQAQHSTVLPTLDAPNLCHCTLPGFQSKGRDSRSLLRKPPLVPVPVHRRCFIFFFFPFQVAGCHERHAHCAVRTSSSGTVLRTVQVLRLLLPSIIPLHPTSHLPPHPYDTRREVDATLGNLGNCCTSSPCSRQPDLRSARLAWPDLT